MSRWEWKYASNLTYFPNLVFFAVINGDVHRTDYCVKTKSNHGKMGVLFCDCLSYKTYPGLSIGQSLACSEPVSAWATMHYSLMPLILSESKYFWQISLSFLHVLGTKLTQHNQLSKGRVELFQIYHPGNWCTDIRKTPISTFKPQFHHEVGLVPPCYFEFFLSAQSEFSSQKNWPWTRPTSKFFAHLLQFRQNFRHQCKSIFLFSVQCMGHTLHKKCSRCHLVNLLNEKLSSTLPIFPTFFIQVSLLTNSALYSYSPCGSLGHLCHPDHSAHSYHQVFIWVKLGQ